MPLTYQMLIFWLLAIIKISNKFCANSKISRAIPLAMVLYNKVSFANEQFSGLDTRPERAKLYIICFEGGPECQAWNVIKSPKLIFSTRLNQPNQYMSS